MFIAKPQHPTLYWGNNLMRLRKSHLVLNTTIRLKYLFERTGKLSNLYSCINQLQTCLCLIIIIIKHTVTMFFLLVYILLVFIFLLPHYRRQNNTQSSNFFRCCLLRLFSFFDQAFVYGCTHFLITIDTTESSMLVYPRSVIHFFSSSFCK